MMRRMYAAILHLSFPPENHTDVVRFLGAEMLPVIRDNDGFLDFRVMDAGVPGELVMIDIWRRREDSEAAGAKPGGGDRTRAVQRFAHHGFGG